MKDKQIEETPLGLESCNCNPEIGGTPRCKLGQLSGVWCPKTIQLRGASGTEVVNKKRDPVFIDRKYKVMLIAEAPGADEDELGIPFVGRAGDILTDFLSTSGMDLEEVYITNMCKCRPPKNRKPAREEIKQCLTYIYKEIREIQPKIIMLLGNTPSNLFNLNKLGGITKIRGKLFEKPLPHWEDGPVFKIIPTLHPASFLHRNDPKLMARVRDDFRFANNLLQNVNYNKSILYPCKFEVADTVEKVASLVESVKEKKIFAFDTESPNLNFKDVPMRLLQISIGKDKNWVIPFYKHNPEALGLWKMDPFFSNEEREKISKLLKDPFENSNIAICGHNLKYDANVILRWLGIECNGMWWDTSVMHHLLYEYRPHTLEYLADVEFGVGDYSFKVREIVGQGKKLIKTYDYIPDEILWLYGATDAESTFRLAEVYFERLSKKPNLMKLYMEESLETIKSLREFEWVGNKIVKENIQELEQYFKSELEDLTNKCRQYTTPEFNPGSPEQVAKALTKLGFYEQVCDPTSATGFCTDKAVLTEIEHPLARSVIDYRNRNKMLTTYVNNILEDIDQDGRVRYGFNPAGPTNGRLSCKVLHQMPRIDHEKVDKGAAVLRSIFGEEEDYLYFYGDFSQIELRIFAYQTGERELIEFLEQDKDIHRLTASAALEIDFDSVSDENRSSVGKRLNFGVIYGSEGYAVSRGEFENPRTGKKEIIGKKRAFAFVRNFRERYTKVDEYLRSVPELAICNGGIVTSVFGRERRMTGLNDPDLFRRGHAEREATNFTISNPAAAITLRTINLTRKMLKDFDIGLDLIRPLNTVHDSVGYGVHVSMVDWFGPAFKAIAERRIPEICDKIFPVKYGFGRTWTEAELNAS